MCLLLLDDTVQVKQVTNRNISIHCWSDRVQFSIHMIWFSPIWFTSVQFNFCIYIKMSLSRFPAKLLLKLMYFQTFELVLWCSLSLLHTPHTQMHTSSSIVMCINFWCQFNFGHFPFHSQPDLGLLTDAAIPETPIFRFQYSLHLYYIPNRHQISRSASKT